MIRIWDTENGTQVQELRRGADPADVYCLSFDPSSKYVSCSSDKGTIHIFAIKGDLTQSVANNKGADMNGQSQSMDERAPAQDSSVPVSNTKSFFSMFGSVLPKYFSSEWSLAQCRLKDAHVICAIKDKSPISVSLEGFYYLAEFDPKTGGDCTNLT